MICIKIETIIVFKEDHYFLVNSVINKIEYNAKKNNFAILVKLYFKKLFNLIICYLKCYQIF